MVVLTHMQEEVAAAIILQDNQPSIEQAMAEPAVAGVALLIPAALLEMVPAGVIQVETVAAAILVLQVAAEQTPVAEQEETVTGEHLQGEARVL
jgi:hypothetical protein